MVGSEEKQRVIRYSDCYIPETNAARTLAKSLGSWVAVNAIFGKKDEIRIDDRFIRLVDEGVGIIDIMPTKKDQIITLSGLIYNPRKGSETVDVLIDICKAIATSLGLDVKYVDFPLHTHIEKLMTRKEFNLAPDGKVIRLFSKDEVSQNEYPNLIDQVNNLVELKSQGK